MSDASETDASDWRKPLSRQEMEKIRQTARDERTVKEKFWEAVKRLARNLPFTEDLAAAYFCAFDPATDFKVKATLLGALAYFILPIDLIPDAIPLLGFTDDAAVLALALKTVGDAIRPEHRDKARATLAD
jgi:uncharacterized membrane protein YkvA (DUF1232 family)